MNEIEKTILEAPGGMADWVKNNTYGPGLTGVLVQVFTSAKGGGKYLWRSRVVDVVRDSVLYDSGPAGQGKKSMESRLAKVLEELKKIRATKQ